MKSATYTEIKKEHQTGRNGNAICCWALRNCLQNWFEESFTRLFLLLPEASVMGTSHEQCFPINFKCSFLRIFCKNLEWKKRASQNDCTKQTAMDKKLLVFYDWEISQWRTGQDHSHYHVCCVRNTIGSPHSNSKALGKCLRPTCVDDILKSYGRAESCPSYSKANMWSLHGGCLMAQSCPSWLGKSPREVYLIWCLRRNKQINETLLHNTLLSFPLPCIPSVMAMFATKTRTTKKGQKKKTANWWWEHSESPDCLWYSLQKKLTFHRVKLLQCDHLIKVEPPLQTVGSSHEISFKDSKVKQ